MADFVIGVNAKAYRNTGSWAAPNLTEMAEIQDCRTNLNVGEADVTTRGGNGWEQTAPVLKSAQVEFGFLWVPTSANLTALLNSFLNQTPIELWILDGAYNVVGSQGLRAYFGIFGFNRNEELRAGMNLSITAKPTYSVQPPVWFKAT